MLESCTQSGRYSCFTNNSQRLHVLQVIDVDIGRRSLENHVVSSGSVIMKCPLDGVFINDGLLHVSPYFRGIFENPKENVKER